MYPIYLFLTEEPIFYGVNENRIHVPQKTLNYGLGQSYWKMKPKKEL